MNDKVNSPNHYKENCSIECIDIMQMMFGWEVVYNFCICNAYKYLHRHKFKNGLEDLNKAQWYVNYALKLMPNIDLENVDELDTDLLQEIIDKYKSNFCSNKEQIVEQVCDICKHPETVGSQEELDVICQECKLV